MYPSLFEEVEEDRFRESEDDKGGHSYFPNICRQILLHSQYLDSNVSEHTKPVLFPLDLNKLTGHPQNCKNLYHLQTP
jgi:transcription termination factor NusB